MFAPYCGGVSRQQDLSAALQILGRGALHGRRPVAGRVDTLRTPLNSAVALMERLDFQLRFPGNPEGDFDFAVTTHQLVVWLMICSPLEPSEPDLPNGFWKWLLIERGDAPEQA